MIDNIYSDKILEYAANISKIGRLNKPDATSKKHARLCGSTITVDLKIENDIVTDFAHEVRACVLGQAAASLLAYHIIGQTTQNLKMLREIIYHMLTEDGPPPPAPFEAFSCLQPIKNYKARHTSTLLIFDAVIDCIQQIEEK
ncbi:iron-sulfur cluster assembly scaffold protein [Bartonella henselae]|uniref:NIF system FeS cluster assembly NifU N-terminal domain-containing protein n=1 Tax=Bartonella henselae (strain ATCC 49882 / DSM 28221 / CCUG 30454 / Houston 1) TaxID=283166 RepID=A0A0H3M5K9_BARHE|nr:iron-sulfur cluster assembly scaffold protein [Bartonella henselae]ATP12293.1 iron-sulfur cluster assembly scaffold protein [Bartonella henselae]OLL47735.1 iron-sulfur cluster assembly scaffold protein [Bartonella henselae]PNM38416.1 iron-sulfur cluster assembly scaffold protein [Bartonella henselae str. Houston-1]UAK84851.1 iron-sulfur cluster assembly scaffold protein [Bartonella henselae]UJM35883.1 iron-sulfur cluster assembly scaffold protein [Bartonella henselae]